MYFKSPSSFSFSFSFSFFRTVSSRYCERQIAALSLRMASGEAQSVEEVAKVSECRLFVFICSSALYSTVLSCRVLSCSVVYCSVLCCTVLFYAVLYFIVLYYTVLHSTLHHCTVLFCAILYCTLWRTFCSILSTLWLTALYYTSMNCNTCLLIFLEYQDR